LIRPAGVARDLGVGAAQAFSVAILQRAIPLSPGDRIREALGDGAGLPGRSGTSWRARTARASASAARSSTEANWRLPGSRRADLPLFGEIMVTVTAAVVWL
jgi:hypothetical protein